MKAIWSRTGETVDIIKELNENRYVVECKNSYEICIGIKNKNIRTTANKADLKFIDEELIWKSFIDIQSSIWNQTPLIMKFCHILYLMGKLKEPT